jgi:hypothetical protein
MERLVSTLLSDAERFVAEQERFLAEDARDVEYLKSFDGTEDLVQRLVDSVQTAASLDLTGARHGDLRFTKLARQARNIAREYKAVLLRRCGWTG